MSAVRCDRRRATSAVSNHSAMNETTPSTAAGVSPRARRSASPNQARLAPLLQLLELLGDEVEAASREETLPLDFGDDLPRPLHPRPPVPAQLQLALDFPELPPPKRTKKRSHSRAALLARLFNPELTLRETALLLNVCPTTVRRYTNSGLLPHYRTEGNQRRFRLSDILAFMAKHGKR